MANFARQLAKHKHTSARLKVFSINAACNAPQDFEGWRSIYVRCKPELPFLGQHCRYHDIDTPTVSTFLDAKSVMLRQTLYR
ncbi:MAG: hypothetical protein H6915_01540 [Novosphingobium sp.]|nr:hypothetical protein [Novosphingobium sp.]MCP5388425.1 hypothetical protein [Novosphingobium sp.]